MSENYIIAPPAHAPLFMWGNAKATTGTYSLKANYGFENFVLVNVVKLLNEAKTAYVSISDRGNARFSKKAAEDCVKFVRKRIRAGVYSSMVPALSPAWVKKKKALGLAHQVGMATELLLSNISAFRTNIKGHAFTETGHTGFVVGVNQKADFSKDKPTVLQKKSMSLSKKIYKKEKVSVTAFNKKTNATRKKKYSRYSSEFLNAKLYWLEHGRTGTGFNGVSFRQPPRPVYTKAIEEFIRREFKAEDFIGQLKMGSRGLEFKFKAHR